MGEFILCPKQACYTIVCVHALDYGVVGGFYFVEWARLPVANVQANLESLLPRISRRDTDKPARTRCIRMGKRDNVGILADECRTWIELQCDGYIPKLTWIGEREYINNCS